MKLYPALIRHHAQSVFTLDNIRFTKQQRYDNREQHKQLFMFYVPFQGSVSQNKTLILQPKEILKY